MKINDLLGEMQNLPPDAAPNQAGTHFDFLGNQYISLHPNVSQGEVVLPYKVSIENVQISYGYYLWSTRREVFAMARARELNSLDSERFTNSSGFYSLMVLSSKVNDRTYDTLEPALKNANNIFQVDSVSTLDPFEGQGLAKNAYIQLAQNNFIVCSDKWQTPGGRGIWSSLIKKHASKFDNTASSASPFMVVLLTRAGFIARDVLGQDGKSLVKPFSIRPNQVWSIDSNWVWTDGDAAIEPNLLFFGKTALINSMINSTNSKLITYSDYRTLLNQSRNKPTQS